MRDDGENRAFRAGRDNDLPLQVHLDTSDYSVLSEAMLDPCHPAASIFIDLCRWVDDGKIEIRYSAVHAIEIAHLDSGSREFALRRARCLQRLTKGKCFRFWSEVQSTECLNVLSHREAHDGVRDNDNHWYADLSDQIESLHQVLADGFRKAAIESTKNRQQRRALERRYFPGGHLSREALGRLQKGRTELLAEISRQFPFSERFYSDDLPLKFAAGKVSAQEIGYEMSVVLRDMEKFIGWTYDTRDKERKLVSWLRRYGESLIEKISLMREQLQALREKFGDVQMKAFDISAFVENQIVKQRCSSIRSIRTRSGARGEKYTSADWSGLEQLPLGMLPSVDAYVVGFCEHCRRSLQMNRKLKASDAGDIFHMSYLPYCDIFRADGDASQIVKRLAVRHRTVVVSKLQALSQVINDELRRRKTLVAQFDEACG